MAARRKWRADVLKGTPTGHADRAVHCDIDLPTSVWEVVPPTRWIPRLRNAPEAQPGRCDVIPSDRAASSQEIAASSQEKPDSPIHNPLVTRSDSAAMNSHMAITSSTQSAQSSPESRVQPKRRCLPNPKPSPRPKAPTKWGRCCLCQRALVPRIRHSDGNAFLSCSRWPQCTFARSVPWQLKNRLPDRFVVRRRVDF